jgi:predicted alpha/beta-hydrolase family hydrolase
VIGSVEPVDEVSEDGLATRGFLHRGAGRGEDGLVLAHGAGSDCRAPALVRLATAFATAGLTVLRIDLPYRQERRRGPPSPAGAGRDREGLRRAASVLRRGAPGRLFLGGVSYGGRQASLLAADDPVVADALLLVSYPLHPPGQPANRRVQHFARLRVPALFVHGDRDPFGALEALEAERRAIPAATGLLALEGVGHGLHASRAGTLETETVERVVQAFLEFVAPIAR